MSKDIRIESLADIFQEIGINATPEQIEQLEKDFSYHLDMEREMSSYAHVGHKQECSKCKSLENQLREAKQEIEVYRSSVKKRRGATHVWTEGDSVMFE